MVDRVYTYRVANVASKVTGLRQRDTLKVDSAWTLSATDREGVASVVITWGDGLKDSTVTDSVLTHAYAKASATPYVAHLTVVDKRGMATSFTDSVLVQRVLQIDGSVTIDADGSLIPGAKVTLVGSGLPAVAVSTVNGACSITNDSLSRGDLPSTLYLRVTRGYDTLAIDTITSISQSKQFTFDRLDFLATINSSPGTKDSLLLKKVRLVIRNAAGALLQSDSVSWRPVGSGGTGDVAITAYLPHSSSVSADSAYFLGFDAASHVRSRSATLPFLRSDVFVLFDAFTAGNAMAYGRPAITPDTVSINDSVTVSIQVGDSLSSEANPAGVASWSYDWNGSASIAGAGSGITFKDKVSAVAGSVKCHVRIVDSDGNVTLDSNVVQVVQDAPVVTINDPGQVYTGTAVQLSGTATQKFGSFTQVRWDFDGDTTHWDSVFAGNPATVISHVWADTGVVAVRFSVQDDDGNVATSSRNVRVMQNLNKHAPYFVKAPTLSDSMVTIGDMVTFSIPVTDYHDNGGDIRYCKWDLDGDGSYEFANPAPCANVNHVYAQVGDYVTRLRLDDYLGDSAVITMGVHVFLGAPIPVAGPDTSVFLTEPFHAHGTATDPNTPAVHPGQIKLYLWDWMGQGQGFDDSSTVSASFSHVYPDLSADTTYRPRFCVRDDDSVLMCDTVSVRVRNRAPVIAAMQVPQATASLNDTLKAWVNPADFTDVDGNQVDSLFWDLDGNATNGFEVRLAKGDTAKIVLAATPESRTVRVVATDKWGFISDTVSQVVVAVNDAPRFYSPGTLLMAINETFSGSLSFDAGMYGGTIVTRQWSFDNTTFQDFAGNTPPFVIPWTADGNATIYIRLVDDDGVGASYTIPIQSWFADGRDGQHYTRVLVGGKVWMGNYLNWAGGNSVCYNGIAANCNTTVGRAYVYTSTGVCPTGWHMPAQGEMTAVFGSASGSASTTISAEDAQKLVSIPSGGNNQLGLNIGGANTAALRTGWITQTVYDSSYSYSKNSGTIIGSGSSYMTIDNTGGSIGSTASSTQQCGVNTASYPTIIPLYCTYRPLYPVRCVQD